jgi:bifunctional non-homologous end joining protein LigD
MPQRSLDQYRAKRDFTRSPEPSGKSEAKTKAKPQAEKTRSRAAGMKARRRKRAPALRYCVQKHLASHLHYDFRLEHRGVLLSWAVPKGPSVDPSDKRLAMMTEDHPLDYGAFEGVIPEGYGAGIVMLWDEGTWEPIVEEGEDVERAIDRALSKGELKFNLHGVKLKGSWVLVRTGMGGGRDSRTWLLIKHRDEGAAKVDILEAAPDSVKSFGGFAEILAAENPRVWVSNKESRTGAALFKDGVFNPPARGGETGAMFREVIQQALKIAEKRGKKKTRAPTDKRRR